MIEWKRMGGCACEALTGGDEGLCFEFEHTVLTSGQWIAMMV